MKLKWLVISQSATWNVTPLFTHPPTPWHTHSLRESIRPEHIEHTQPWETVCGSLALAGNRDAQPPDQVSQVVTVFAGICWLHYIFTVISSSEFTAVSPWRPVEFYGCYICFYRCVSRATDTALAVRSEDCLGLWISTKWLCGPKLKRELNNVEVT